ncbi:uncharacterized protein At1g28695-like, partial [Carica papaya]|uniref:uncharacterized protein At1g28695-like n=1 Tax=Carica papaya TaxID=3649 RepID=UPI000B8CB3CF
DTDIIWLRNPFNQLSKNETMDMQISVDMHNTDLINTGFYYVKSNNKTISLFKKWYQRKENSTGMKEQDVLAGLLNEGIFTKLGLTFKLLDTLHFSGFCQDSTDIQKVITVHANCCRHIGAKFHDLARVLHEWKQFKASPSTNVNFHWSPHTQCWNSWNDTKYRPIS